MIISVDQEYIQGCFLLMWWHRVKEVIFGCCCYFLYIFEYPKSSLQRQDFARTNLPASAWGLIPRFNFQHHVFSQSGKIIAVNKLLCFGSSFQVYRYSVYIVSFLVWNCCILWSMQWYPGTKRWRERVWVEVCEYRWLQGLSGLGVHSEVWTYCIFRLWRARQDERMVTFREKNVTSYSQSLSKLMSMA